MELLIMISGKFASVAFGRETDAYSLQDCFRQAYHCCYTLLPILEAGQEGQVQSSHHCQVCHLKPGAEAG